jgi:hypothetical protein
MGLDCYIKLIRGLTALDELLRGKPLPVAGYYN